MDLQIFKMVPNPFHSEMIMRSLKAMMEFQCKIWIQINKGNQYFQGFWRKHVSGGGFPSIDQGIDLTTLFIIAEKQNFHQDCHSNPDQIIASEEMKLMCVFEMWSLEINVTFFEYLVYFSVLIRIFYRCNLDWSFTFDLLLIPWWLKKGSPSYLFKQVTQFPFIQWPPVFHPKRTN